MSQKKGIQTSFTSMTSGVYSQVVSKSWKMFSEFKVESRKMSSTNEVQDNFEAEKSGNVLFLLIVETYDQQIRLKRAEIERLKTMKSIDQAIHSQVKELTLARSEALQLRQKIQLQSDCMKKGVK